MICSADLEVPEPKLTVTSHGTGSIIKRASSSVKGSPKILLLGLPAPFGSKVERSAIEVYLKAVQDNYFIAAAKYEPPRPLRRRGIYAQTRPPPDLLPRRRPPSHNTHIVYYSLLELKSA